MKKKFFLLKESWLGLLIACVVGLSSYGIKLFIKLPIIDELLIALIIGIVIKSIIKEKQKLNLGFAMASSIFIPIGILFYGAINLNFVKFATVELKFIILLAIIILTYFGVILGLGKLLKQKEQITYLVATGSAICGASAIVITAPVVKADPKDVSISLIAIFLVAVFGLFVLFPFLNNLLAMSEKFYALLSAMVFQFTGFVKSVTFGLPQELSTLALVVKGARYLGLLIALPLFAILVRKKFYIPWFL